MREVARSSYKKMRGSITHQRQWGADSGTLVAGRGSEGSVVLDQGAFFVVVCFGWRL